MLILLLLSLLLLGNDGGCYAARLLLLSPPTATTSKVSVDDGAVDCNPIGTNRFDSSGHMVYVGNILQSSTSPPGQSSGH
jgi:hypothetical protein